MKILVNSILPVKPLPRSRPNFEPVGDLNRENEIILRIGLSGTISVEVLADESGAEERLREALTTIHPLLERLREVMRVHLPNGDSVQ